MEDLKGKYIVLGVSGGIAAYKMADVASALKKAGADVHVVMTKNAAKFIGADAFEALTGNKCYTDTFERDGEYDVKHITMAKAADLFLIAPASADLIAKLANGIADDMLTSMMLAARGPRLIAPSMNTFMLENPATQRNIKTLAEDGYTLIDSASGRLACGDTGKGKLPDLQTLLDAVSREIAFPKDLAGLHVTVTAGPTREPLDPVRYLTNRSSGKMGYAIARNAMLRGADVTLISGPTALDPVPYVKMVDILSAKDMFEAVKAELPETDILIKAAAVADYRPATVSDNKIKKKDEDLSIALERTDDIIAWCGKHRHEGLFLCGFSMETEHMLENSRAKLEKKGLDMIAANNVKVAGAGFAVDTNVLTLITPDGAREMPLMSKDAAAAELLDEIVRRLKKQP
jgi:phosphopantothenoylcysteine decarboxylase/phosphopantothenate--cysteine ligase